VLKRGGRGDLRIDRLSGVHRRDMRADSRGACRDLNSTATSFAGYSPERIKPRRPRAPPHHHPQGDFRLNARGWRIFVDELYASIVTAGTHKTSSIRVAEAAKVIEKHAARREHRAHQRARPHLQSLGYRYRGSAERKAGSKWNFLPFRPGLVGGHCIGGGSVLSDAQGAGDRFITRR